MTQIDRRTFITGLGAAVSLAPGFEIRSPNAQAGANRHLTSINAPFLITEKQANDWHAIKDSKGGPTLAGSPSWKNYLEMLERELRATGVVDVFRNPWTYTRWSTSEWPDDSGWSLHVDGRKVKVASYGCNSGRTPAAGVTGELVVYKTGISRDELRGKIAIIVKTGPENTRPAGTAPRTSLGLTGDYEYLATAETFSKPAAPSEELNAVSPFRMMGLGAAEPVLTAAGALGAVLVLPLSYDALAGTYTFGVPPLHEMPTLYLDRDASASAQILAAAGQRRRATLRLISTTEQAETYQLFGYLPGKDYGTPEDRQVLLVTHTDGPSISQENGALGILGMVRYFANIPRAERPRTLMVFLDCRHYMPGAERAFSTQDYVVSHPDVYSKVIAAMGIEHLGQMQVADNAKGYHRTGLAELSSIWVTNNDRLVDLAIRSVKENRLSRVQVQNPARPGVHGGDQGPWYGLGGIARRINVPGAATMGLLGAYWSTKARMDYLDSRHFVRQVATMSQICGELMVGDIATLRSA